MATIMCFIVGIAYACSRLLSVSAMAHESRLECRRIFNSSSLTSILPLESGWMNRKAELTIRCSPPEERVEEEAAVFVFHVLI
ncbi:uncharacterized protein UDID_17169 [Ustilago sp. UG-2017a]|nr:uncharacterized protein UDID_17169 [Ustilago sp. UG-2017a]